MRPQRAIGTFGNHPPALTRDVNRLSRYVTRRGLASPRSQTIIYLISHVWTTVKLYRTSSGGNY